MSYNLPVLAAARVEVKGHVLFAGQHSLPVLLSGAWVSRGMYSSLGSTRLPVLLPGPGCQGHIYTLRWAALVTCTAARGLGVTGHVLFAGQYSFTCTAARGLGVTGHVLFAGQYSFLATVKRMHQLYYIQRCLETFKNHF